MLENFEVGYQDLQTEYFQKSNNLSSQHTYQQFPETFDYKLNDIKTKLDCIKFSLGTELFEKNKLKEGSEIE